MKTVFLWVILLILLAAVVVAVAMAFGGDSMARISMHGWIALTLGSILSLALGAGLMALSFISSRRGFDDGVGPD